MSTRSPTEITLKNPPPGSKPVGVSNFMWEACTSFGPYLRGLRAAARFSLRAASEEMGVSFSYLAKLETGEKSSPPTLKVLKRIAEVYGRDLREVMHEAGFVFETPEDLDAMEGSLDARFIRLVTFPALRPMRMDAQVIEMIPPLVKRQWIEFARKMAEYLIDSPAEVDAILSSKPEAPPRKSADAQDPTPEKPTTRPKLAIR